GGRAAVSGAAQRRVVGRKWTLARGAGGLGRSGVGGLSRSRNPRPAARPGLDRFVRAKDLRKIVEATRRAVRSRRSTGQSFIAAGRARTVRSRDRKARAATRPASACPWPDQRRSVFF